MGWFSLSPDSIKLSAFRLENNTAKVNLFLKANSEIFFGKQPTVTTKPLPDNDSFTENNSLNILLPISTDYSFVETQIKKNLKIQEGGIRYPPTGNKYLKVTNVNIYGYSKKIVVKISFDGTNSGYAYLEGTPSYDALTNVLSFPDLNYSVDTKSLMLKAIDFFQHDDFIEDLRNRLTVNLNEKVTQLKSKVVEALNKQYKDFILQETLPILGFLVCTVTRAKIHLQHTSKLTVTLKFRFFNCQSKKMKKLIRISIAFSLSGCDRIHCWFPGYTYTRAVI